MRAGIWSALNIVLIAFCASCAARDAAPQPPISRTPIVFAPLTVQVEPKYAVVRIGRQDFHTDAAGTVTRECKVGEAYYVSARAEGYHNSRTVLVTIENKDVPTLYFVLRKKGSQ